ncbi:ATP synthase subunit gamma, mitochondrial, partial [Lemmus lemmus]
TGSLTLNEKADVKGPEENRKHPLTGVSLDGRFCGAIHSSLAKQMENEVASLTANGKEVILVGIGEKIGAYFVGLTLTHFDAIQRHRMKDPTFGNISIIVLEFLNCEYEFDEGSITFNQFKFVISHKTVDKPMFALNITVTAGSMSVYDDIEAHVLQNYQDYSLVSII